MANKYKYKDIFNEQSFNKGFSKLEGQLKEIDMLIKNLGKQGGLKEVNKSLGLMQKKESQLKSVQKERQKILKQQARAQDKKAKQLIRENQALDVNLQREKALHRVKAQRIRQEANLYARKELGIKQNSRLAKSFKNLIGRAGAFIGIYGVFRLFGNMIKTFKDFEKSNKKLQAILGVSAKEIKTLSNQAKELGASTVFTASQVTGLQTELAKLGFTLPQINASTEGILSLAAATGTDLSEAATLAGAAVRIFGLTASETSKVADVLALSTSKSALDMQKLATALPIVGTTAKQAGLNIEQTTALLGTLADRGIDASTAATSLRMIFIQLAKKGISFNDAMIQINESTNKTKTAVELFGARAATAATILSETGDATANLTEELNNAKGAAQEMADVMLDNLAGDITKAASAWEGLILSIEDGDGPISNFFRIAITGLTKMLNLITDINNGFSFGEAFWLSESDMKESIENYNEFLDRLERQAFDPKRKKRTGSGFDDVTDFTDEERKRKLIESYQAQLELLSADQKKYNELSEKSVKYEYLKYNTRFKLFELQKRINKLKEEGEVEADLSFLEKETEETNKNTDALNKNIKARESLSYIRKELGIEGPVGYGFDIPEARTDSKDPGAIQTDTTNQAKTTGKNVYTDFQLYMDDLFSSSEGTFLGRMFGGGEDGEAIATQVRMVWGKLTEIIDQNIQQQLARIDELLQKQEDAINKTEGQLEAEKNRLTELQAAGVAFDTTEKQRLEKRLKAEQQARDKTLKEQKKAKEKAKRLDIIQANINIAGGIIKAIATSPPPSPIGLIGAAVFAALGAVQLAQMKSAKYAEGTNYLELNGSPSGRDTIPIWADEGERILSKKHNAEIPRTFPNSMIPTAVSYFLDSKSQTPILNARSESLLGQIAQNTKKDGIVYRNGEIYQIRNKYSIRTRG